MPCLFLWRSFPDEVTKAKYSSPRTSCIDIHVPLATVVGRGVNGLRDAWRCVHEVLRARTTTRVFRTLTHRRRVAVDTMRQAVVHITVYPLRRWRWLPGGKQNVRDKKGYVSET